jgi:hypothetical protein
LYADIGIAAPYQQRYLPGENNIPQKIGLIRPGKTQIEYAFRRILIKIYTFINITTVYDYRWCD